jgi:hypothetical protein
VKEKRNDSSGLDNDNKQKEVRWEVLAIDSSRQMIEVLRDKIRACEWTCVHAVCTVLARHEASLTQGAEKNCNVDVGDDDDNDHPESVCRLLGEWKGTADVVVASCVLPYLPPADVAPTMRCLAALLRPGTGHLVHSEWCESVVAPTHDDDGDRHHKDDAMTKKTREMHSRAGLETVSVQVFPVTSAAPPVGWLCPGPLCDSPNPGDSGDGSSNDEGDNPCIADGSGPDHHRRQILVGVARRKAPEA